jgi:hypothetical protein
VTCGGTVCRPGFALLERCWREIDETHPEWGSVSRLRVRSILGILSIPAIAACATSPPRDAAVSRCAGQPIVVVNNDWNRPVDIYASTGAIHGIVEPGRREEFFLPRSAAYAYPRVSYRGSSQRVPRRAVRIRYFCQ